MGRSRRQWGWHRLDPRWAERLVADAEIPAGATVVDVGAGLGSITEPLLARRVRVIAVEADPGRAAQLRDRFGDAVVVVRADAADLRLPRRSYHVVANPPFNVTSALLGRLLQPGSRLFSAHIICQDQAARRWTSPSAPGAGRWARTFEVGRGRRIPRSAFHPRPHVDARILVIRRRPGS